MTVLISATPLVAAVIGLAWGMGEFGIFHSTAEGRTHILVRLIFFLVFDAAFARNLAELFVLTSRPLSRLLPGAVVPPSPAKCAEEERVRGDSLLDDEFDLDDADAALLGDVAGGNEGSMSDM